MKDSANLNVLRAIAVALVVVSHLALHFVDVLPPFSFRTLGHAGVAIFFVHTTLVLMMSLERHGPSLGPFVVRRFFRIYPLSMVAVVLAALLMLSGPSPMTVKQLLSNLLLVQNLTLQRSFPDPLWSLPYEVQMYLLLPALHVFIRSHRSSLLRVTMLYGVSLAVTALAWHSGFKSLLIGFIPCFLAGALAYALRRHVHARCSPWILFGASLAGAWALAMLVSQGMDEVTLFWALCLLIGLLIPLCREVGSVLLVRGAGFVAKYSYGIYLSHVFIMWVVLNGGRPLYVQLLMFVWMQGSVAYLLYRFIEAPATRLGGRLAGRLQERGNISRSRSIVAAHVYPRS